MEITGRIRMSRTGFFFALEYSSLSFHSRFPAFCYSTAAVFNLAKRTIMEATKVASTNWDFSCNLEVDYHSDEIAQMVYAALVVDKELQPEKVRRQMSVSDGKLFVRFEAVEARFLRASYSAFLDVLTLATKTIEEFGSGSTL